MSRVFVDADGVRRGLTHDALDDFDALAASDFFSKAVDRGDLVRTERTSEGTDLLGEWAGVVRHETIDIWSYPYEWPFEMLRDAALLQLRLTREALAEQLITKDASPYNVQFVGTRPTFVDIGSFERLRPDEPWPGYRQFCELFLNPLLLQALRNMPFQPWLRGSIHGIPTSVAADLLRGTARLNKTIFTHVRLHAMAERKYSDSDRDRDVRAELKAAGFGRSLIDAQLKNLEAAVRKLTWHRQSSTWSEYSDRSHYGAADLEAKERFVEAAIVASAPNRVLDLGANDGHFSRLAVRAGAASVVAVDSDDLVVDRLYRDLVATGERRILPLVIDLSDPSPALGWRSRERSGFVHRMRPDLVLCLAVVHHLALTNTIPLDEVVGFLAEFGAPVVVEFPHPDDPMASRLLARKRPGVFEGYERANWEQALGHRFAVTSTETLPGGTRTLYACDPL